MESVCVFCGGNPGTRPSYAAAARRFGEALAARGFTVVYGGGAVGLMGAVAGAALARGGRVLGVMPDFMIKRELAHPGLSELVIVGSMHERKATMAARSDAFAALPGGFGTMDELFEILTWAQLGIHAKPCGLLNINNYFDPLIALLDHMVAERFLRPEHRALALVDDDAARLLSRFAEYQAPNVEKWLDRAAR